MYYRIIDVKLYDYSDTKYSDDCIYTDIITEQEYREHPNKVIIADVEKEIEVPEYDEDGNPIMIEYEDTELIIDYDEEGNPIGSHTIIVVKKKQKTHTETITVKELVLNPDYEEEEAEKEKEKIKMLSLTKREVFLALYHDKGITPEQLRAQITDTEALIEFDYAEKYYRGNPLINSIGAALGYSSYDLDYLFLNKEFPEHE